MKKIIRILRYSLATLLVFTTGNLGAQDCYEVVATNSGVDILYDNLLDQLSCEIETEINGSSNSNQFEIIGCDFYPIYYYSNPDEPFQSLYDKALEEIKLTKQSYLMTTKEHWSDGRVRFRVDIGYPNVEPFISMNPIEKTAIENIVLEEMVSCVDCNDSSAERRGLAKFLDITRNGLINPFAHAGFVEMPTIEKEYVRDGNRGTINGVKDLCGGKIDGKYITSEITLPTIEIPARDGNPGRVLIFGLVITDDYSTPSEILEAESYLLNGNGSSGADFTVWTHISLNNENTGSFYYKATTSLSTEERNEIIAMKLEEQVVSGTIGLKGETNNSLKSQGSSCGPAWNWGEQCLLSQVEDDDYALGIGIGMIDGVISVFQLAYSALVATKSAKDKIMDWTSSAWNWLCEQAVEINTIGIAMYTQDKLISVANSVVEFGEWIYNSFEKIYDFIQSDFLVWAAEAITMFVNSDFSKILELAERVVETFMNSINSYLSQGAAKVGYDIGKLAGEILGDIFVGAITAGAATGATIGKYIARAKKLFSSASENLFGKFLSGNKHKIESPSNPRELRCGIGLSGCFVKDTPVLIANNPFKNVAPAMAMATMPLVAPIQEVKVDDMVKAYHHEEMYITASNTLDDIYVPGWQDYDYLDITPETWQVGKFVITEEDGSVVEIEANRPKKWFEDYELKQKGDQAFIQIEEMGIADYAVLQEIRSTDIDTRDFVLNENGKVDRPVITTYKRIANEITDYTFSNGQVISCTPNHPFYSSDRQEYIPIGEFTFGETVQTSSDREVKFIGGKAREKGEHVYNFEVWREHNYYVGFEGSEDFALVHNSCPKVKKTLVLPNVFQNWINTLKTKLNPRRNYDDGKFEKHVTGDDIQYEAVGGGDKIWADGIDVNRNAVVDAKHNPGDFYTLDSYLEKPFLYGDLEDEFRRYGKVIGDSSNPAAELIIKISNDKEASDLLFKHLGLKFNVPTSVEVVPWTP